MFILMNGILLLIFIATFIIIYNWMNNTNN